MNYISTAGYCGTGSSIPNDLLKECEGCKTFDIEFKLLTGIDGLIDLEKAILDSPQYIKNGIHIKRFKEFCKKLNNKRSNTYNYSKYFCEDFEALINEFLDKIVDRYYLCGSSQFPLSDINHKYFSFGARGYRLEFYRKNMGVMEVPFIDISSEKFFLEAQNLIKSMFERYEEEGYHTCVLEQALMPVYAPRLPLYFPEGKMIIVDWDPRDLVVSEWNCGDAVMSELHKNLDAEFYAKYYRNLRNTNGNYDSPNILHIRYEKLALDYEKSKNQIFEFVGIDPQTHKEKYRYFDPRRSARNIGKWKNYSNERFFSQKQWLEFCDEVKELLPEYCFDGDLSMI